MKPGKPTPPIELAGGAAGSARVREALERHTVVLLDVDPDTAWQRAGGRRPPLPQFRVLESSTFALDRIAYRCFSAVLEMGNGI